LIEEKKVNSVLKVITLNYSISNHEIQTMKKYEADIGKYFYGFYAQYWI